MKFITLIIITFSLLNAKIVRNYNLDVVVDTKSNLMWQDDVNVASIKKDWINAVNYCENLNFAGYNDWYLPGVSELDLLRYRDDYKNKEFQNCFNVRHDYYWTSTQKVNWHSDLNESNKAFAISYRDNLNCQRNNGYIDYLNKDVSNYNGKDEKMSLYVRCVRKSNDYDYLKSSILNKVIKVSSTDNEPIFLRYIDRYSKNKIVKSKFYLENGTSVKFIKKINSKLSLVEVKFSNIYGFSGRENGVEFDYNLDSKEHTVFALVWSESLKNMK